MPASQLEAAVNQADKLDRSIPNVRSALDAMQGRRGAPALRNILDRLTFVLTDSELERRFLPIARRAGLGKPLTGQRLSGFKVDFYWPELGLVVETDGLRYHRTTAQQARDLKRDQVHALAGLTTLRFHARPGQVRTGRGRSDARGSCSTARRPTDHAANLGTPHPAPSLRIATVSGPCSPDR